MKKHLDDGVKRYPVTKEYLAMALSGKLSQSGYDMLIPIEVCQFSLYKSVEKMIYGIAKRFAVNTSRHKDLYDLSNDCAFKMFKAIHNYDSGRAKFTTWCHWVCENYLKGRYMSEKNECSLLVEMPTIDDSNSKFIEPSKEYNLGLSIDMIDAIECIKKDMSSLEKDIVNDIFGYDSGSNEYRLPGCPNFAETSRRLNVSSNQVSSLFKNKVEPILAERFSITR